MPGLSLMVFPADEGIAGPRTQLHRAASQAPAAVVKDNTSWQLWDLEEGLHRWSPG